MKSLDIEYKNEAGEESGWKFYDLKYVIDTRSKTININSNPRELATQLANDITAMEE